MSEIIGAEIITGQKLGEVHHPTLRNDVGHTNILEARAPQAMASYKVIEFHGLGELPRQYVGLIYSKWLRSLRHGNDYFGEIDALYFYGEYKKYLTQLLGVALIRLAVLTDDDDVVLGFSVSRGNILDYVHVLRIRLAVPTGFSVTDYRRQGIGARLVPKGIDTFTHLTKWFMPIWKNNSKYKEWKFNPFA